MFLPPFETAVKRDNFQNWSILFTDESFATKASFLLCAAVSEKVAALAAFE